MFCCRIFGFFLVGPIIRCRLAARDVTVIYNTMKAWTAMPRFAD